MAEFRLIDHGLLEGYPGSEAYQRLLMFEPEKDGDSLRLPFGRYDQLFPFITARIEHPAVMNPFLAAYLWRRYVNDGDIVIDPMAGVGGTPV